MFCWVGGGEWGCMGYYFWQVEKYWVGECVSGKIFWWGGVVWGWEHCLIMPNTKQMTRVRNIRIKIWK